MAVLTGFGPAAFLTPVVDPRAYLGNLPTHIAPHNRAQTLMSSCDDSSDETPLINRLREQSGKNGVQVQCRLLTWLDHVMSEALLSRNPRRSLLCRLTPVMMTHKTTFRLWSDYVFKKRRILLL